MSADQVLKLDIGSGGPSSLGGDWLGIDLYAEGANYAWPMDKLPLPNKSVSEIYSSHALEHMPREKVIPTLQEWFRVLKWEGTATVLVPDLRYCLKVMNEAVERGDYAHWYWRCDFIWGRQNHPGNFHYTGFTDWLLDHYFAMADFKVIKRDRVWMHDCDTLYWVGQKVKS